MANLTEGKKVWGRGNVDILRMPVQASTEVFMGSTITRDSSGNVGERADSEKVMGICNANIDNSAGSAAKAGRDVEFYCRGRFKLAVSGLAAGDEHKAIFAGTDDNSYTYNPKSGQYVGHVEQYDSSGKGWVRVEKPGAKTWHTWVSLADDAGLDLPAENALVIVRGGANGGVFHVGSTGTVTKLSGTTNCVAADTDAKLCVCDKGARAEVKNRTGATLVVAVDYFGID